MITSPSLPLCYSYSGRVALLAQMKEEGKRLYHILKEERVSDER